MLASLGTSDPFRRPCRTARAGAAALVVTLLAAGCSEGDPEWQELGGWRLNDVWSHEDVVAFDRVAVTAAPEEVAWFTRERGGEALAVWRSAGSADVESISVETPDDRVAIPLSVAVGDGEWVAAAATRERPNGENTGVLAWRSSPSPVETPPAEALRLPGRGAMPPRAVNAAQAGGIAAVAGIDEDGEVVTWTARAGADWRAAAANLGVEGGLVGLDLATAGDGFVLAGVDADGGGHVWTSDDARAWEEVPGVDPPTGVLAVTLLGPLSGGDVAVAWPARPGDEEAEPGPLDGTRITVQRLDGGSLADEGTIEAGDEEGVERLALTGAAPGADGRLVAVGWTVRSGDAVTPALWVGGGGRWQPSSQPEFTGRVGFQLRAVARTDEGELMAVATPSPGHIDVELWRWQAGGSSSS